MITQLAIVAIVLVVSVLVYAALRSTPDGRWSKCPSCHWYHNQALGMIVPRPPSEGDGVIRNQLCGDCISGLDPLEIERSRAWRASHPKNLPARNGSERVVMKQH